MRVLFLMILCGSLFFSAQVGINVIVPQATLDIKGKPTETNIADGIILPRLTGDQLKAKDASYTSAQNGSLVYVTEAVTSASAKTTLVTEQGMYFYDSIQGRWRKLITGVPLTVQAFNGQRRSLDFTTVSAGSFRTLDFPNVNISPTADIGSWDSAENKFTVNKAGVFTIFAGVQMYDVGANGTGAMTIVAGNITFGAGTVRTIDNGTYSINCNGSFSGLLEVGDQIYLSANSGSNSWHQGNTFLHIVYNEF